MSIFALVELELHRLPEFQVSEIAQNILGFDDLPELKPETLERGKRIVEQSGSGWNFDVLHDQFTQSLINGFKPQKSVDGAFIELLKMKIKERP